MLCINKITVLRNNVSYLYFEHHLHKLNVNITDIQ